MKCGKAPGKDGITNEIYKSLPSQFLQVLVKFLLESGRIPQCWCTGVIVPIPKNGDNLDVNNYRGITLLPVIAKLLFATLSKRLYAWGELHNINPVKQFGF